MLLSTFLVTISAFVSRINILDAHNHDLFSLNALLSLDRLANTTTSNFTQLAAEYGFPASEHEVVTDDGYILRLFHIPGKSRFPIFLLHGILDSSDTWIIRGERSLGITLAKLGYDLWFGNSRGNKYSRRHIELNPDTDPQFWAFSFNEVGNFDIPAFIDTIQKETGSPSVTAIGHSQGTTSFYALGASRPDYNDKVNVLISLAPVVYFKHAIDPLRALFQMAPMVNELITNLHLYEVLGETSLFRRIFRVFCAIPVIGYAICLQGLVFPFTGYDSAELEPSFFPTVVAHAPAGTSGRSFEHYLQVGHSDVFAPFDFGPEGNEMAYNASAPPPYDLGKVSFPVALIAGRNDRLSMVEDVLTLKARLPNVVYYAVSPRLQFNHLDDIWGRRMRVYLFPLIFQVLNQYNNIV